MKLINRLLQIYTERFSSLEKIRVTYTKVRMRSARGNTFPLINEIKGLIASISSGGIIVLLIDRYFHWLIPIWILFILWLINKILDYLLGKFDEKVLKFWQAENDYSMVVSPFFKRLDNNIQEIKAKLNSNPETK